MLGRAFCGCYLARKFDMDGNEFMQERPSSIDEEIWAELFALARLAALFVVAGAVLAFILMIAR